MIKANIIALGAITLLIANCGPIHTNLQSSTGNVPSSTLAPAIQITGPSTTAQELTPTDLSVLDLGDIDDENTINTGRTSNATNSPSPSTPKQEQTPNKITITSGEAYQKTLFPILQNNCARCHEGNFASSDITSGHDYLLNNNLVNLNDPTSSKIVAKIAKGHKGISTSVSEEIKVAITAWSSQLKTP